MSHYPDFWKIVVLKIKDRIDHRVVGGWSGGYLTGDSWRISSGITSIVSIGKFYEVHNTSGSVYYCRKDSERLNAYTSSVVEGMKESYDIKFVSMEDTLLVASNSTEDPGTDDSS